MGCLDCSSIHSSGNQLSCQHGLPIDLHTVTQPEECEKGMRTDNYFGKTYGMKQMISLVLSEIGEHLSKTEKALIEQEKSVTEQVLLIIETYEQKIDSFGIKKPETKDRKQGCSCYHCIHGSTSEDYLFIQCGFYHNDIGESFRSCETLKPDWEKAEQMIRTIGLSHFFDLLLQYNSSLWLYIDEDLTAGDKWVAIIDTYEQTIQQKAYRIRKLSK